MQVPESLKSLLAQSQELDNQGMHTLLQHVHPEQNLKKSPHIEQGEPCTNEYFLLAGQARFFVLNTEGDERTLDLCKGPTVLTPHLARTKGGRSLINIEISKDALLWSIKAEKLLDLMVKHASIRAWGNQIMQLTLIEKTDKELCLATKSAKDRLVWLRTKIPDAEVLFSHTHIASFLGMTPVSLSRLRHQ